MDSGNRGSRAAERSSRNRKSKEAENQTTKRGKAEEEEKDDREKGEKEDNNINIGTFNIIDGRSNRIELASWMMRRHNVDICFLTETKLNGYHTSSTYGYDVVATKCNNSHQGVGLPFCLRRARNGT